MASAELWNGVVVTVIGWWVFRVAGTHSLTRGIMWALYFSGALRTQTSRHSPHLELGGRKDPTPQDPTRPRVIGLGHNRKFLIVNSPTHPPTSSPAVDLHQAGA